MELFSVLTPIVSIAIPVILVWIVLKQWFPPIHPDKKKKIPPYSSATIMDFIKVSTGTDAPFFALKQATELGYPKVFSVRIPIAWRVMFVTDQKISRDILTDPTTTKPPLLYSPADQITTGKNIFSVTTNGSFWKDRRKGSAHAFASAHVKRMRECCSKQIECWIEETLKPSIEAGRAVALSEEMNRITLRVIFSSAFEYEISREDGDKYVKEVTLTMIEYLMKQSTDPLRKLRFWLSDLQRAGQAAKYLQDFSLRVIQAHRENPLASKDTLIGRIVNNPCYKDDKDRAADVTIFLFAGHDTTGYSLSWVMLYLAKHPEEMKKLRSELRKCPSREAWSGCAQLRNVIRETFRIMPVGSAGSVRTTGRDFEYKDTFIPKGTVVFLYQFLLGRNPNVFEKPNEFIPDRWNNATPEQMDAIMPFSLGTRNCVGQSLANAELNCVVPSLVMDYDWEVVQDGNPEYFVTMRPAGAMLRAVPLSSKK